MKALLTLVAMLFTLMGWSATANFVWDANPASDAVTGYRIYWGPNSRTYTNNVTLGNVTTGSVTNLNEGDTYYFAATAYNAAGESDFSNEVFFTVPMPRPQGPSALRPLVTWLEKRFNGQASGLFTKLVAILPVSKQVKHVPAVATADIFVGQRT